MAECSAGIDVAEFACCADSLEHSVHGDGSYDEAAGVYRLYARCRQAQPQLVHIPFQSHQLNCPLGCGCLMNPGKKEGENHQQLVSWHLMVGPTFTDSAGICRPAQHNSAALLGQWVF